MVEPAECLCESLLLRKLERLVTQIGADGESVRDTTMEANMPRLTSLIENILRLVSELGGEDLIDFYSISLAIFPMNLRCL